MYTIDTSVWVNGSDTVENGYEISRECLSLVRQQKHQLVLPTLILPEVAGAISRTRADADLGERLAAQIASLPTVKLVPLDETLAKQAQILAAQYRLRGADAVYAALAQREQTTLVSLDREHLTRLTELIRVISPSQLVALLKEK